MADEREIVRHEEELTAETRPVEQTLRASKRVEREPVDELVPRELERADVEYAAVGAEDSGEVEMLPDGSVSIPVLEEELVITKRTVVRERIVIRKRVETVHERIRTELRKERVELETEGDVDVSVDDDERTDSTTRA